MCSKGKQLVNLVSLWSHLIKVFSFNRSSTSEMHTSKHIKTGPSQKKIITVIILRTSLMRHCSGDTLPGNEKGWDWLLCIMVIDMW